jgi:hypothetical protein
MDGATVPHDIRVRHDELLERRTAPMPNTMRPIAIR